MMHSVVSNLVPAADKPPPNSRVFNFVDLQRIADCKEREMKIRIGRGDFIQLLENFGMPAIVEGQRNIAPISVAMINNGRGNEVGALQIESAKGGGQ